MDMVAIIVRAEDEESTSKYFWRTMLISDNWETD